jgi:hypothetical protein
MGLRQIKLIFRAFMNKIRTILKILLGKILGVVYPYSLKIERYSIIERMSMNFARGALNRSGLKIDPSIAHTWEFCAFSQNGEDGIVDFLLGHIKQPNRFFIEIGSSDGLENNSSYLAFAKKYSGIMIEGDRLKSTQAKKYLDRFNWGVKYINAFVDKDNITRLLETEGLYVNPDYFSLDIDGIDYYIMESVLSNAYRPKIICLEYNSSFGPVREITIPYKSNFNYLKAHPTHFYYGVSVMGWRKLLKKYNYEFITVDSNGVNAFFIDRSQFTEHLPKDISGSEFIENFALRFRHRNTWADQFELIKNMSYYEI